MRKRGVYVTVISSWGRGIFFARSTPPRIPHPPPDTQAEVPLTRKGVYHMAMLKPISARRKVPNVTHTEESILRVTETKFQFSATVGFKSSPAVPRVYLEASPTALA